MGTSYKAKASYVRGRIAALRTHIREFERASGDKPPGVLAGWTAQLGHHERLLGRIEACQKAEGVNPKKEGA